MASTPPRAARLNQRPGKGYKRKKTRACFAEFLTTVPRKFYPGSKETLMRFCCLSSTRKPRDYGPLLFADLETRPPLYKRNPLFACESLSFLKFGKSFEPLVNPI